MPTPEQIARVRLLAEKWKEIKPEIVNLNTWHKDTGCGTIACLGGHACLIPEFIEQGFHLDPVDEEPYFHGDYGITACHEFFGAAGMLFATNRHLAGSIFDKQIIESNSNITDHALAAERMRMWLELHDKEIKDN